MKKFEQAEQCTLNDLKILDEGEKAALKLITFMQATNTLPLPEPQSEYDKRQQTTFDILNDATSGAGAAEVEFFHSREENLTSIPPSDVNARGSISKTINKNDL